MIAVEQVVLDVMNFEHLQFHISNLHVNSQTNDSTKVAVMRVIVNIVETPKDILI